ncbi:MAG: hypothetical protein ACI4IX_09570 [Acutalibacteraceae bacterium]
MKERLKNILQKIPFSLLSVLCILFTYLVSGIGGMLVIPALLCIFFVMPYGALFAILDMVIRKKKLMPIICLILSVFPIVATILMIVYTIFQN